jgi:BTB/POZ domain
VGYGKSAYFNVMLSSSIALGDNEEYFIDRNIHCFHKILDYMSTGELSTKGLNSYVIRTVYMTTLTTLKLL